MKVFTKFRERKAQRAMEAQAKTETERLMWCIQQAVWLEDANKENLLSVAERIYEYVYGARDGS